MPERDPMEELRNAWGALEAPDATPEECDPQTAELMRVLRNEWQALRPPVVSIPLRLRRRSVLRRAQPFLQLAATFLLLLGGAVLVRTLLTENSVRREVAQANTEPAGPGTSPVQGAAPQDIARVVLPASRENGIVMTHGKVRLVMLTPEPTLGASEGLKPKEKRQ